MDWTIVMPNFKSNNVIITKINDFVLLNLASEISLKDMSQVAGVSTFYLCRLFKKELQISPIKWLWTQRVMAAAASIIANQSFSLTDVAFSCGFTSSAHFSRLFKLTYGIKPSAFRKKMINENEPVNTEGTIPNLFKDTPEQFSMIDYSLF